MSATVTYMHFGRTKRTPSDIAMVPSVNYKPTPIALDFFLSNWLPGLERDGHLVGVQFNADLAGLEVDPSQLATDLSR